MLDWATSRPIAKCTTAEPGEEEQVWVWARTFCREEDAWSDKTSAMILVIVWTNTWTYNCKTKKTESSFHGHNHNVSCSDADFGKGTTILGHQLRLSLQSSAVRHIESVRCQIFENRKPMSYLLMDNYRFPNTFLLDSEQIHYSTYKMIWPQRWNDNKLSFGATCNFSYQTYLD